MKKIRSNQLSQAPSVLFVGPMLGGHSGWVANVSEALAPKLQETGYSCHLTSRKINRYIRLLDILWTILRLRRDYSVMSLQVFGGPSFIIEDAASWLAGYLGKRIVMVLRGGAMPEFMARYPNWATRVLSRAQEIVTPSGFLADAILPYGFRATIIPNAIEVANYPSRIRRVVRPHLLWMRTFHEIYNPQMAVQVLEHLATIYPDASLTMAGQEKGLLNTVKAMVKEKHLESQVRFVGFLDISGKQHEFSQHDIFLNTNRVDNMPTSVVEASAFGMPIVATSVGGVPYLIQDGENGLLVPNENSAAMALAVTRLMKEPELAERLSRNAIAMGRQYDWAAVLPQWDALFQKAQAGK
jgi:glycosyltransferase involved in cell wall biosynthesis